MTNKAEIEQTLFHSYSKHARINNPTFVSNFVNDSLTLFTPQKVERQQVNRASEYRSNFEPFTDKLNFLNYSPHYHKYSKDALERNRSYLSHYGTNLLSQNLSQVGKK